MAEFMTDLVTMTDFMTGADLTTVTNIATTTTSYAATAFHVTRILAPLTSTSLQVGHGVTATFTQILNLAACFKYLSLPHLVGRLFMTKSLSSVAKADAASVGALIIEAELVGFLAADGSAVVDSAIVNSSMTWNKTL
jgi:hypothetical protein